MSSSRTATMPADVILDTAVLKVDRAAVSTKVGASRGGLNHDPGTQWRYAEHDGQRKKLVGLDRVAGWDPKITGKLLQLNSANLKMVEPGHTRASTGIAPNVVETITPQAASTLLVEGEYLENVRLEYLRGNGGTFAVVYPFGLVTQWKLASQDNNEAEFDVTIEARDDAAADDNAAPFYYEITGPDIVA